jgi:hypothetical protein
MVEVFLELADFGLEHSNSLLMLNVYLRELLLPTLLGG